MKTLALKLRDPSHHTREAMSSYIQQQKHVARIFSEPYARYYQDGQGGGKRSKQPFFGSTFRPQNLPRRVQPKNKTLPS